ncbi:hypothetical protein [uncultured Coprobacter sp.]|uniref:hypothetical protein n=1 Tax=uncultured Coprobacter sp. TaxID=1720550 RepID=UPI0025976D89|nr:hypothetical protein [uncultured Coprobacter sp.]
MNKFTRKMMLAIACIIAGCINVQAQQIKGDFDAEWIEDTKGNGALPGQFLRPGTQPVGWEASNVNQKVLMEKKEIVVTPDADRTKETGYSVKMENKFVGIKFGTTKIGSNTPAYITLGTPWVFAITDVKNCDGGTLGGIDFSFRPDSIVGHYKRTVATAENALILTYFWKGNCTSTVRTNPNGSASSETTTEVQNKDLCILGKETPTSGDAQLIAKGEYNITEAINDWTRISVPIDYYLDEVPEKMNIIISSANYWDRQAIQEGNILYADDIEFIYNSKLESLKIGGVAVDGFDKDTYNYTITGDGVVPTEDQIEAVSDGKGASIETTINENVVTIVVKGNDYSENNNNTHTYTLTYQDTRSQLSSLSINGTALEGFSKDKYDYTVSGEVPAKDQIIAEADGKGATVDIEINEKVVTITVSGSNIATDPENKHVYTLTFDYEQGIENNGTIENLKIYSINGNVFVQGYTGTVEIYLLNGGKVAQKEVSGSATFSLEPNTYIIRTGTKTTKVIVK